MIPYNPKPSTQHPKPSTQYPIPSPQHPIHIISVTTSNSICSEVRPPKILGNLKANIRAENLLRKGIFTGEHSRDNAFLLLKGKKLTSSST